MTDIPIIIKPIIPPEETVLQIDISWDSLSTTPSPAIASVVIKNIASINNFNLFIFAPSLLIELYLFLFVLLFMLRNLPLFLLAISLSSLLLPSLIKAIV